MAKVGLIIPSTATKPAAAVKRELVWKLDRVRGGIAGHKAYAAQDYLIDPSWNPISDAVSYSVYQGDAPSSADRRLVGSGLTLEKAKALAQQDHNEKTKGRN
jgi:hypothetical protein